MIGPQLLDADPFVLLIRTLYYDQSRKGLAGLIAEVQVVELDRILHIARCGAECFSGCSNGRLGFMRQSVPFCVAYTTKFVLIACQT